MKLTTIYGLSSSRNGELRYIGQTTQAVAARLRQHRSDASRRHATPVQKWIAKEVAGGFVIELTVLQECAVLHVDEIAWIAKHKASGTRLLNLTEGGEGTIGHRHSGRKRPDLADRNRAAKGTPGRPSTAETNAKISAANRGRKKPWLSERNANAAGLPGHPHTEASRAAISEALKGRTFTPEWRAKISAAKRGASA